jgi:DNA-binding transcriptional ArsR family regulator
LFFMIEFALSGSDLTAVRFAVSPLNELTLSLRVVADPGRYPLHLRWRRALAGLEPGLDMPMLTALTNARGWTPDFLSPDPRSPITGIEDEIDALAATPPQIVARDVRAIHARLPKPLDGPPRRVLGRVVDAVRGYWQLALAPHWDRMHTILDADIAYRGKVMAEAGLAAMLSGISGRMSFTGATISVRIDQAPRRRSELAGDGLTLLPSLFALHTAVPVDPKRSPLLIYAARGSATLWETPASSPSAALVGILGQTRASLLTGLAEPASSTEIARRTGVTTSAVNQHLRALRDAGLLTCYRYGRHVRYLRTDLGQALVGAGSTCRGERAGEVRDNAWIAG